MKIWTVALSLLLVACSSPSKNQDLGLQCGHSPVQASDLVPLGLKVAPGKIVVVRLTSSWCPFCHTDMERMAGLFHSGAWKAENVHVLLIAYKNHSENQSSLEKFRREKFAAFGFPEGAVDLVYLDQTYAELVQTKNSHGDLILSGWKGVPFGLVFGKDQRLAYRGHFTSSDTAEDQHYKLITQMQAESCGT